MFFFNCLKKFLLLSLLPFIALTAFEVDGGLEVRRDSFRWSIAGYEGVPNILSELEWKNVKSVSMFCSARIVPYQCYELSGYTTLGKIYKGEATDTDYQGNNRQDPFFRGEYSANKGHVIDLVGFVGWKQELGFGCYVVPQVGYSYFKQHLALRNLYTVIDEVYEVLGPQEGIDSRYTAEWVGPNMGGYARGCIAGITLSFGYYYHKLYYKAEGYWNTRDDFVGNFKHTSSKARGHSAFCSLSYALLDPLAVGCLFSGRYLKAWDGKDHTPLEWDGELIWSEAHLNEAVSHSYALVFYLSLPLFNPSMAQLSPARRKIRNVFY